MSHNDSNDVITENPNIAYEEKDVNIKAIAWFGGGLLVLTVVAMILVWGIMASLDGNMDTASPSELTVPPEPRLQPNPIDHTTTQMELLHREMARQEELLNSYGWVDKEAGVAHMPIEEAMKLTIEKYQ
jgi:hypothetical protein